MVPVVMGGSLHAPQPVAGGQLAELGQMQIPVDSARRGSGQKAQTGQDEFTSRHRV